MEFNVASGIKMLSYSILVDGVEIADPATNNYVLSGTKIEHTKGDALGNFASIRVDENIESVLIPSAGMDVVVSRGEITKYDNYVFRGKIKKVDIIDDTYVLICADKLQELKYKLFTKSYDRNADSEAGEVTAIFKDIAEDGDFTVSTEDSGTGTTDVTLDKFRSSNDKRLDRLQILSSLIDWVFYYDYDNEWIRHEPRGFVEYTTPLVVGENIANIPKWEENIENMRNVITIEGASQLDTRIDSYTASADTEFDLTYAPESIEVTVDGVLQVLGIEGATTTYDYTLDIDLKKITFLAEQTGDVVITYTAKVPAPVTGENINSINEYGVRQEDIFAFNDISTVADGEARLQQLLSVIGISEKSTTIQTNEYTIGVGNKIIYSNPQNSLKDGSYIVSSKVINYGEDYDVLKIGTPKIDVNKIFTRFDERLKQLEGTDTEFDGILRRLFNLSQIIPGFNVRYVQKNKLTITGNVYDVGNLYDDGLHYDVTKGSTEVASISQGNSIYEERIYDTDFFDSSNSTGEWNTTTNVITMTSGEIIQTKSIYFDGTSTTQISDVTFSLEGTNISSGVYYISGDGGSNWELIMDGQTLNIANRGYDLLLKMQNTTGDGWPTAWGAWGSLGIPTTITKIICKYNKV